jgi:hypothetical protein
LQKVYRESGVREAERGRAIATIRKRNSRQIQNRQEADARFEKQAGVFEKRTHGGA